MIKNFYWQLKSKYTSAEMIYTLLLYIELFTNNKLIKRNRTFAQKHNGNYST